MLRQLAASDAEALFAAHGDPQVHHFWSSPAHENVAETARYIEETLAISGARAWAITQDGGAALGRVALFVLRDGVGELGIIMRRDAQRQGLALRALELVCGYGFGALGLHRLAADIDPDNWASLSLFLRAGFEREGLLRQNWKTHIGLRDSVMLAKLRADA